MKSFMGPLSLLLLLVGCNSDPVPSGHYRTRTVTIQLGEGSSRAPARGLIEGAAQSALAFAVVEDGQAVEALAVSDALEGEVALVADDSTVQLAVPFEVPIRIIAYDFATAHASAALAATEVSEGQYRSRYYSEPVSLTAGVGTQVVYLNQEVPEEPPPPPDNDSTDNVTEPSPPEEFSGFFYFAGCSIEDNDALNPIPILLLFSEELDNQTLAGATSQPCQETDPIVLRKDGVCQDLNFLDFAASPAEANFNSSAPFVTFLEQAIPKFWASPDNGTYTLRVSDNLTSSTGAVLAEPIEASFRYTNGFTWLRVTGCDYLVDYWDSGSP